VNIARIRVARAILTQFHGDVCKDVVKFAITGAFSEFDEESNLAGHEKMSAAMA
jgi:hypothetical protein